MKKILIIQIIQLIVFLFTSYGAYNCLSSFTEKQEKRLNDDSEIWMERMYIESNIFELIHNDNSIISIPQLNSKKELLVCYYSSLTCGACVNFAISKIDEFFPSPEEQSRIYFVACNFNEKAEFQKKNTIRWNKKIDGLAIEESNNVCYFIVQNNSISRVFIPEEKFENYTNTYLKEIKKKYF